MQVWHTHVINYTVAQIIYTTTVQPVATCRHSPYVHKPAIIKLLLPSQVCFSILSVCRPRPASHA